MQIEVIGVPIDLGADRRGVDMGPSAIRYAGLQATVQSLGLSFADRGDIAIPRPGYGAAFPEPNLKYLAEVTAVNAELAARVQDCHARGSRPLVLGGDHSLALGSVLGTQAAFRDIGVLWVDAHGDFNNHLTTPSGNLHGMPLAAAAGYGPPAMTAFRGPAAGFVDPRRIALVGVRSIDPGEAKLLRQSGVCVFTMADIDMYGMREVMERAFAIVTQDTRGFHLSFDMDVLNPTEAPGVGTPVPGGLTYREAHLACEMVADTGRLLSLDLVEVNPILDTRNQTAQLAVELIASALGKKIM